MSDSEEHVQLVIQGVDKGATKVNTDVTNGLKGIEAQTGKTAAGINRIVTSLTTMRGQIRQGFNLDLGHDLHDFISDLTSAIPRAFFGAIDAGHQWLATIKEIQRATGLSAEGASEWASVMQRVGVPLGDVSRILSQLGRNLLENEDLFKRAGIATRDQNGQFLDTYTILTNIRQAMSRNGESIQNAGLAQELLARGGYKWLEVLQLTDEQWKTIATDAARSGQIVTDQQTRQAEELSRLQQRVQGAITGLQTAIFSGIVPVLNQFVDQFANWIEQHMQQIAQFVANVASFITGVIGGLLGIDFVAQTSAGAVDELGKRVKTSALSFADWSKNAAKAKTGDDALTTSLNAQIKAIDAQIAAVRRRSDAQHAAEERARLDASLATAQQQLADLKGNAPFTAGLSNAEAVLARQKHAQDIIDAEKAVADAKSGINQFEADQSVKATIDRLQAKQAALREEVAAHKKAVDQKAAYETYLTGVSKTQDSAIVSAAKAGFDAMTAQAKTWRDNGVGFANDVKGAIGGVMDALFGSTQATGEGPTHGATTSRSGGLIGALGGLGGMMDKIKTVIEVGVALVIARVGIGLAGAFVSIGGQIATLALALGPAGPLALAIAGIIGLMVVLKSQTSAQVKDEATQAIIDSLQSHGGIPLPPGYHVPGGATGAFIPAQPGGVIMRLGEGREDEWVIPRSKMPGSGGGGGAGAAPAAMTIVNHFHFDFISMPSTEQLRKLTDAIDERMQIKAGNAPVGMRAFRGATT